MSGVISLVPTIGRMERLEDKCWRVVKEKLAGIADQKKISMKKLTQEEKVKRKQEEEERKRKQEELLVAEGLVGWRYGEKINMVIKEEQWRSIQRDIVSTVMLGNTMEHMY